MPGDRRIDAAIDHFVQKGYDAGHVTAVVRDLHKVYGGPSPEVWRILEEGCYAVVQERLFNIEEEEKQKQKQDAQLLLEFPQHHQDDQQVEDEPQQVYGGPSREVWRVLEDGCYSIVQERLFNIEEEEKQQQDGQLLLEFPQHQDGQQVEDEPPQHQEPAADDEEEEDEQPTGQNPEVQVLRRIRYIDELVPENTENAIAEDGEPMTKETEDGIVQAGRRARSPRQKKPNVRLAGPEWAK